MFLFTHVVLVCAMLCSCACVHVFARTDMCMQAHGWLCSRFSFDNLSGELHMHAFLLCTALVVACGKL
jgi:hypothetical protein